MLDQIQRQLDAIKANAAHRETRATELVDARLLIDERDRPSLHFLSNDYLNQSKIISALLPDILAIECRVGSRSAALLGGYSEQLNALEKNVATWLGHEDAVVFSSGYLANLGLIQAFADKQTVFFQDKQNHASLIQSNLDSSADMVRYHHTDATDLRKKLSNNACAKRRIIVTESVFSMSGKTAPLADILNTAEAFDLPLFVDEAHALGVFGHSGNGLLPDVLIKHANHSEIQQKILVSGTFGKAVGLQGAFIAGSHLLIDWIRQKAKSYIYTTAISPLQAALTDRAINIIKKADTEREKLAQNIKNFRVLATKYDVEIIDSKTPIQGILTGDNATTLSQQKKLKAAGIYTAAIRPPTVAPGQCRLRISLSSAHSVADFEQLFKAVTS